MIKNALTDDTVVVIGGEIPLSEYRNYFSSVLDKDFSPADSGFMEWLNTQSGKTLEEALQTYSAGTAEKNMDELMFEKRFNCISDADKEFIIAFSEQLQKMGYDFGGNVVGGACWGKYMIIYSKTGVKTKKVIARIYVRDDNIALRLFFNNIDKHIKYIENTSEHIKKAFLSGGHGSCNCRPRKENCKFRKSYTIAGQQIEKCSGEAFVFEKPDTAKLPGYIALLIEFYPVKRTK